MSLPFLPGYTTGEMQGNKTKTQSLVYKNGYAVPKVTVLAPITNGTAKLETNKPLFDPSLTYTAIKKDYSYTSSKTPSLIKPVVKAAKPPHRVLGFDAYFVENVPNSTIETERVRIVTINYFLDDNTIMVKEKKLLNSGLPQGVIVKRQKVPREGAQFGDNLTLEDFNLGVVVSIFGRNYRIADADAFTKNYFSDISVPLNPEEDLPNEDYSDYRKTVENPVKNYQPNPAKGQLKKFLETDGQVLRFYCSWDNRNTLFGEKRPFILHYFLVDDSVEVREVQTTNSGHHPFAVFLKRQKLPKKNAKSEFISPSDFRIGEEVDVFGRTFFIYDCDKFTRNYYADHFGISCEPIKQEFQLEDSLQLKTQTQQRPLSEEAKNKKRFQKMLEKEGQILRFSASMESMRPEDKNRVFVASYYLADDTIGIYEPSQRNSGIIGGKFLERKQVVNPETGSFFTPNDFYVGATIEVFSHRFILHDADEYAYNYMEANSSEFPMSDIQKVLDKIKSEIVSSGINLKSTFTQMDKNSNGFISLDEFRTALIEMGFHLTEQEIITVIRRYDLNDDYKISYEEFVTALS